MSRVNDSFANAYLQLQPLPLVSPVFCAVRALLRGSAREEEREECQFGCWPNLPELSHSPLQITPTTFTSHLSSTESNRSSTTPFLCHTRPVHPPRHLSSTARVQHPPRHPSCLRDGKNRLSGCLTVGQSFESELIIALGPFIVLRDLP